MIYEENNVILIHSSNDTAITLTSIVRERYIISHRLAINKYYFQTYLYKYWITISKSHIYIIYKCIEREKPPCQHGNTLNTSPLDTFLGECFLRRSFKSVALRTAFQKPNFINGPQNVIRLMVLGRRPEMGKIWHCWLQVHYMRYSAIMSGSNTAR